MSYHYSPLLLKISCSHPPLTNSFTHSLLIHTSATSHTPPPAPPSHLSFRVVVNSDNLSETTFAGPGAGRFPTANSVMNDLIR